MNEKMKEKSFCCGRAIRQEALSVGLKSEKMGVLGAPKHLYVLYNWLSPWLGRLVRYDDPHGAPYWPTWPCFPLHSSTIFYSCCLYTISFIPVHFFHIHSVFFILFVVFAFFHTISRFIFPILYSLRMTTFFVTRVVKVSHRRPHHR